MNVICRLTVLIAAAAVSVPPSASAQSPILQMLSKKRQVELVATGGQFLEGPLFDHEEHCGWLKCLADGCHALKATR